MIPRRQHHYGKDGPSVAENTTIARSKVIMAPLHRLTDALIDSIAASHSKRGTMAHARLKADLEALAEARRVNERGGAA